MRKAGTQRHGAWAGGASGAHYQGCTTACKTLAKSARATGTALSGNLLVGDRFVGDVDITQELCQEEPGYLYDLARHLCLASNLAGQEVVPQAADRALQALRDDIASGFDNPYKLRTHPRLEPLRKREDFPKLVQNLEAKVVMQQHVQETCIPATLQSMED